MLKADFMMGNYPAGIPDIHSNFKIWGCIFEIGSLSEVLKTLDEYEGIGESFDLPHEYSRLIADVYTKNGRVKCWIYSYNYSVEALMPINSGDYLKHLNQ